MTNTDPNGGALVSVLDFFDLAQKLDRAALQARFPTPILVETRGPGLREEPYRRSTTIDPRDSALRPLAPHEARIFALRKAGHPTPLRHVTVGRTPNNDIHLPHPSVSKLHAYFMLPTGGRFDDVVQLVDISSMGTYVDGRRLTPEEPIELPTAMTPGQPLPTIRFATVQFDYYPSVGALLTTMLGDE